MQHVDFTRMKDGTAKEYKLLDRLEADYAAALPQRLIQGLRRLGNSLEGYRVSRLTHCLQTATRAERDGADEEMIVAALLHDIGDDLAPHNHASLAASVVQFYVRPQITWIVEQHGLFQLYYYGHHLGKDRNARERLREHPWFASCEAFCENWDQSSFDPDYATEDLAHFTPLLRNIFGKPPRYL